MHRPDIYGSRKLPLFAGDGKAGVGGAVESTFSSCNLPACKQPELR